MGYGSVDDRHDPEQPGGGVLCVGPGAAVTADTGGRDDEPEVDGAPTTTAWQRWTDFYNRNIGLCFVFLAQVSGSIMSISAKMLATGFDTKLHALQIIFVRMGATAILSSLWMWYKQVPDFPLGRKDIRGLLVLRGTAGFTGLFGLYYSLSYLEVSDATVITFIVPTLTAFVCFVVLREPFTAQEALAGLIAFTGVLFVARPSFLFPHQATRDAVTSLDSDMSFTASMDAPTEGLIPPPAVSPAQRAFASLCAVGGTFGAATAYTVIRLIGKRAHSLISVNYFAVVATLGSAAILLVHPDLEFKMPRGAAQWSVLCVIGVAGFLLQFLLTEGLQREKAGRATNLIYTQMVFALVGERVIWGTVPAKESMFGSVLIIGAAVWVTLQKQQVAKAGTKNKAVVVDERSSLLRGEDDA